MARTQALNVTVVYPATLRVVFEGRPKVMLALPATATLGDALQTLFQLYPRLARVSSHERAARGPHWLQVGLDERAQLRLAEGGTGLFDGQTLYLFFAAGSLREEKAGTGG